MAGLIPIVLQLWHQKRHTGRIAPMLQKSSLLLIGHDTSVSLKWESKMLGDAFLLSSVLLAHRKIWSLMPSTSAV